MKLKDIKTGVHYIVTRGSKDTLFKGDNIYKDTDGRLFCSGAGWLELGEWEDLKATVVFDKEMYRNLVEFHTQKVGHYIQLLEDNEE